MKFFINTRSGVPIYKQLLQQIEKGVAGGILKPGTQLPTVREVALELTINPNTVARAYRELEHRGIIESVQGRGTFISRTMAAPRKDEKEIIIKQHIEDILREASQLHVELPVLEKLFQDSINEWKEREDER